MSSPADNEALTPGLAVIHANRLETLRDLVVAWVSQHPLAPLENETVLVQSNGMAQWLKLALAAQDGLGICAAVEVQLPASFLWRCFQLVLADTGVPEVSPFNKEDMAWRIFRQLPERLADPRFAALQRFLADDHDIRKRYQLALCLADLFDQYQVYRADWLADWATGVDQLRDAHGQALALTDDQHWQPALWRALLADVPAAQRASSRAALQQQFLQALSQRNEAPSELPRRVIVFGISSLPQQMLEALLALSRFCQILLCVHNPCRYYWADIIEHKELLRGGSRRHPDKLPPAISDEELHLHANPLLAAWGKQGRDYIGLLNAIDDPEHYQQWFQRIDLFEDWVPGDREPSLLQQVQQAILDLTPLPVSNERPLVAVDGSLAFHLAHSPQREVEILQDQLLALFAADQDPPLQPRDILVMVPDIDRYAPHIRAVFGQMAADDPRYIPFSVSDQRQRGQNSLLIAVEALLHLPESRFSVSELLDLLDLPALRRRFGIDDSRLPTLTQWITEAGVRWGLHAEQRASLGMPAGLAQNTWHFGFSRMLLGYAVGNGAAWQEIEPYDEIGGLDAALLGPLIALLEALERTWRDLLEPATPLVWSQRLRDLLERLFLPDSTSDELTLESLRTGLDEWDALCQRVALQESLPLTVMREVWLGAMDQPSLMQRFLAGRVNFCTLMPMRSIPFQVVCLLGMNDGDFPRASMPLSFDLMTSARSYRPGDRSRRDDDRYLFLEAILSARRCLYLSWVGHSINDNAERPPSLLVGQLRDYLAGGWQLAGQDEASGDAGEALLERLTTRHPLQPFSRDYFRLPQQPDYDARWFTHAREWRTAWTPVPSNDALVALAPLEQQTPLTLAQLAIFLRYPVKAFFNHRLQVWFDDSGNEHEDSECFAFDRLQSYALAGDLLQAAIQAEPGQAETAFSETLVRQHRLGVLPLAGFADPVQTAYAEPAWAAWQRAEPFLKDYAFKMEPPLAIELVFQMPGDVRLAIEDWLTDLRQNALGESIQLLISPQAVLDQQQRPKCHTLLRPWLRHLAACAMGVELTTLQVGADAIVELRPVTADLASMYLQHIVAAWWQGMQEPLPLACRSAFAWLAADEAHQLSAAERIYHGDGYQIRGEVEQDAYLARQYPQFASLFRQHGQVDFTVWLQRLYGPLWQLAQQDTGSES